MAAVTVTSSKKTSFSAGGTGEYAAKISPAGAADTLDLSAVFDSIDSVVATFAEATAANCAIVYATVSGTTITFNLVNADGSTAAASFKDLYIKVTGQFQA